MRDRTQPGNRISNCSIRVTTEALQENHTRETPGQFHSSQQDLIDQRQPAQQQSQGKWQFYQQSRPEQAQDQQRQYRDQGTQQQAKQKERELQFKKMIGSKVSVKDGSDYGTIKDFMVDSQGRVAFVLISHGGLWGLGQETIAVPIETLSFNTTDQKFALNLSKDELENAPTADKEQMSESKVLQIYRFYGIQPYWTTEGYSTGSNRQ